MGEDRRKTYPLYRIIRWLVWLFYPKVRLEGTENIPDEPCVIVGNHTQMNGPICAVIHFPGSKYVWCAGEMMNFKEVPEYAFRDFWSQKPKRTHWFYRILSHLIAPIAVVIFNNAGCIGVYHDTRILSTFRESVKRLQEGSNIVIFPEHDAPYNNILYEFSDRFIDIAKMYCKKTGKSLQFVPVYIAPKLKTVYFEKPVSFDPEAPIEEERSRVCRCITDSITEKARSLPLHTVVPYRNIPKKLYPKNRPEEAE